VLHALLEGDARGVIEAVRHLAEQGPDWNGVLAEILNVLHRVAIAQALPEAVDNGQGDRDRVLALAQALPAEDVQFYYQMGLIGRRDLPLAPDPRGGFEMVLLRMLAFRPADADGAPRVTLKPVGISQATADPGPNPVAGAAHSAAPAAAVAPAVVDMPKPAESIGTAPAVAPTPEPEPIVTDSTPAPTGDLPWNEPAIAEPAFVAASEAPAPPAKAVELVASVAEVADENDDDEPPPGDYDYYEADADSLAYGFDTPEEAAPEPEPLPAVAPATGLAAEWQALFLRLGLSGMTGNIAANCTLISADGDDWLLHLDPTQGALFNATQQRRLNDALNQHLQRTLNLRIELIKPEQETPAQAAARKRAERQRQAEASIHGDPLIQQMIQQFAAVIREDSIEPLST
jgi:DNA polymerase-3 subunit gamma/tau